MVTTKNFLQVEIRDTATLRKWLTKNCTQKESVWLIVYKKDFGKYYIPKQDIIDELLCFGWLDGIVRKIDGDKYLLLVSPRRVEHWSATYKRRIPLLEKANKMMPTGIAAVQSSKKNGSWNFLDDVDKLIKPKDFEDCLKNFPNAFNNFNAFGASHQRFTLRWIKLAKTTETRNKRIQEAASLANENKKIPGL
jgi:uncharacterized protein YdeI (YjbR/CyaY-like superfamily)